MVILEHYLTQWLFIWKHSNKHRGLASPKGMSIDCFIIIYVQKMELALKTIIFFNFVYVWDKLLGGFSIKIETEIKMKIKIAKLYAISKLILDSTLIGNPPTSLITRIVNVVCEWPQSLLNSWKLLEWHPKHQDYHM